MTGPFAQKECEIARDEYAQRVHEATKILGDRLSEIREQCEHPDGFMLEREVPHGPPYTVTIWPLRCPYCRKVGP